jgi:hypothetical protein
MLVVLVSWNFLLALVLCHTLGTYPVKATIRTMINLSVIDFGTAQFAIRGHGFTFAAFGSITLINW